MAEVGHQLVWMGWKSIQIVGASAFVIFILLQKIQKTAKCTFWYQLIRVVPDKVQRAVKWLCARVCMCVNLLTMLIAYVANQAKQHCMLLLLLCHNTAQL